MNRVKNNEIRRREGIEETLAKKVDRRVLRWCGHVERVDKKCWPRKVKAVTIECHQERGRPKFDLVEWGKSALAVRDVGLHAMLLR